MKRPFFARPIIAAMNDDGDVLAFFVDPKWCSDIGGQHHQDDTALDWAIGTDLKKGLVWEARARLHLDRLSKDREQNLHRIEAWYKRFLEDIGP